jgi:hypothetical protein
MKSKQEPITSWQHRYTTTLKQMGHAEGGKKLNTLRNRALSLLSRLQLVTIHPELADGPDTPELTKFTRVPFATPDLPAEEKIPTACAP